MSSQDVVRRRVVIPMRLLVRVIFIACLASCSEDSVPSGAEETGQGGRRDDMLTYADMRRLDAGHRGGLDAAMRDVEVFDASPDLVDRDDMQGDMLIEEDQGLPLRPGYELCDCGIEEETECTHNRCSIRGSCEEQSDCPEGFFCSLQTCECDSNQRDCRPSCESDEECPDHGRRPRFCDPSGHCEYRVSCLGESECRRGEWCISRHCHPAGEGEDRAVCERSYECQSGFCYLGFCRPRCYRDADCLETERCGITANVCKEGTWVCNVTCPEGHDCRDTKCIPPRCNQEGDCTEGSCFAPPRGNGGECLPSMYPPCKSYEFRVNANKEDPYCRLPQVCSSDEDCTPPYSCESNGFEHALSSKYLCSRLP